jgi:glucokinase
MRRKSIAVGMDIGGTKTALAVVDREGRMAGRIVLPTEAGLGFERAVVRFGDSIEALLRQTGCAEELLAGIGIGCAGPLDPVKGLINNPFTLAGWDRCDIVTPLAQRFGVPVRLENDGDVAALGEWFAGAGQGHDPLVMLTFGTGVGGAVIHGGRIYRGAKGEHPELGHLLVRSDGPLCYCGTCGCLESIASGAAVDEAGKAIGLAGSRAVFDAARSGNDVAGGIVARALGAAADAAWTLFHTFLPRRLILGGGVMDREFDLYAEGMRQRLASATQFSRNAGEIVRAKLGNDAGIIGAGSLVFSAARGEE